MNSLAFVFLFSLLARDGISQVWTHDPPKVGQPQFSFQGVGGGTIPKNWNAAFQAGVGTKVWESRNKHESLHVGATYGRGFVGHEGRTYTSQPYYGLGLSFRFK